jgi:hypothetical protein
MAEILARNAKPHVQVQPKEPLRWHDPVKTGPHGTGYMLSECGRYSIAKVMHELGCTYSAWDRSSKTDQGGKATLLGCVGSKEAAIALCEATR